MTTSQTPLVPPLFVGIDVAKDKLDLARSDRTDIFTVPNHKEGIRKIVATLQPATNLGVIVVEATGGLEQPLLEALLDAQLPVARVNPGHVRHFAKALGVLAKTDAIDAKILVEFAKVAQPRLAEKRSQNQTELDALVTCRRQLIDVRTQESNRQLTTASKSALNAHAAILRVLEMQIKKLDQQIAQLIDSDDDLRRRDQILQSAPGVGIGLSSTILAELPEIGAADHREISALAGVAPFNSDSGKRQGKRAIRGGRSAVRSVLYMATLAAIAKNPVLKPFSEKLIKAGKIFKVMMVACMRKFLTLLNTMVRDNLTWQELNVVKNV